MEKKCFYVNEHRIWTNASCWAPPQLFLMLVFWVQNDVDKGVVTVNFMALNYLLSKLNIDLYAYLHWLISSAISFFPSQIPLHLFFRLLSSWRNVPARLIQLPLDHFKTSLPKHCLPVPVWHSWVKLWAATPTMNSCCHGSPPGSPLHLSLLAHQLCTPALHTCLWLLWSLYGCYRQPHLC